MAKKYTKMSEEESLRRSHSKFSNFKLTLVCLLCALAVTVFAASLATFGTELLPVSVLTVICCISGVVTLGSLGLIARFRR